MSGSPGFGNGHPIREPTGAIRTTTATNKAGRCMKGTGTTKTTAITTIMVITTMVITTTSKSGHLRNDRSCEIDGPIVLQQAPISAQFVFAAAESSSPAK